MRVALVGVMLVASATACSRFSASMCQEPIRTALDARDTGAAERAIDEALHVAPGAQPAIIRAATGLLLLERASVRQSEGRYAESAEDLRAADKGLDAKDLDLDLTMHRMLVPERQRYAFHMGWYGAMNFPFVPALHERMMINALNMVNYLALGDARGAKVEARRLDVILDYANELAPMSASRDTRAFSGLIAGFTYDVLGETASACAAYREALAVAKSPLAPVIPTRGGSSPRALVPVACVAEAAPSPGGAAGEILIVVGYGRIPYKRLETVSPGGIQFTSVVLVEEGDRREAPLALIDGTPREAVEVLDLSSVVRADWTDAVHLAGTPTEPLSWETLPARIAVARVAVSPGPHRVELAVRGTKRVVMLDVASGGYALASLMVLR